MILIIEWLAMCLLASIAMMAIVVFARSRVIARLKRSHPSRGLFSFSDGHRIHSVDPIAILNSMEAHKEFRFDQHPSRALDGVKDDEPRNAIEALFQKMDRDREAEEAKQKQQQNQRPRLPADKADKPKL